MFAYIFTKSSELQEDEGLLKLVLSDGHFCSMSIGMICLPRVYGQHAPSVYSSGVLGDSATFLSCATRSDMERELVTVEQECRDYRPLHPCSTVIVLHACGNRY